MRLFYQSRRLCAGVRGGKAELESATATRAERLWIFRADDADDAHWTPEAAAGFPLA